MKKKRAPGLVAVYLLHFETTWHRRRHYVGVTTPQRLRQRMFEHASGRGARETRERIWKGEAFRLANWWITSDPQLEQRHMARAEAIQLCPICRGLRIGVSYGPTKRAVDRPDRPHSVASTNRPSSSQLDLFLGMKKGGRRSEPPSSTLLGQP